MVVRINWSDTETIPCTITLDKELLGDFCESTERFTVCSFWEQTWTCGVSRGDTVTLGSIPPHGAALLKILPDTSAPAVLSSTGHFSMGAELSDLAIHEDVLHMDLDYGFRCPVRYTVRLPEELHPSSLPEGVSSFRVCIRPDRSASAPGWFSVPGYRPQACFFSEAYLAGGFQAAYHAAGWGRM